MPSRRFNKESSQLVSSLYKIVDTHAHLCDPVFDIDRIEVVRRAQDAGVAAVISVSETLSDAKRNVQLAAVHPEIRPAAGLYPTCLDLNQAEEMTAYIRKECSKIVAIGEVGLDFWVVKKQTERVIQQEILAGFINLSMELDLPLNIHSRSAGHQTVAMLLKHGARKVQLHAFDGKAKTALPAVEAGYFFSIPPSTVRSRQKQKLVKQLPLSCLLVETDSPVLGPFPGERNEPANAVVSLHAIAQLKNVSMAQVIETVLDNTLRLYGDRCLKKSSASVLRRPGPDIVVN
jgi:TatD DNase family protein